MTSDLPQQSNNAVGGQPQGSQPPEAGNQPQESQLPARPPALTPPGSRKKGCIAVIFLFLLLVFLHLLQDAPLIGRLMNSFSAAIGDLLQTDEGNKLFSRTVEHLKKLLDKCAAFLRRAWTWLKKHGRVIAAAVAGIVVALIGGWIIFSIRKYITIKVAMPIAAKPTPTARPKPTAAPAPSPPYIAIAKDRYSSLMGVSSGDAAFDTTLADGPMKQQAAAVFLAGHPDNAYSMWNVLAAIEPTDAEVLIYAENQHIRSAGIPYFSLVVVTTFVNSDCGDNHANGTSRDILQGAYVAQQEYNRQNPSRQVMLLIANVPDPANDAGKVAQMIVQVAQHDKTIVGVVGWPYEGSERAITTLSRAGIPVVSPTVFDDGLRGTPGFFSVAPSIADEGRTAALYAQEVLGARTAIVVYDGSDSYGKDIVTSFTDSFKGNIFDPLSYTPGGFDTLFNYLDSAMESRPPDLLFFAGYPADASQILQHVRKNWGDIPVIAGDTLYQKIHCPASVCSPGNFKKLYFIAPAFPDEAGWVKSSQPPFFSEYASIFDPDHIHIGNPYGYGRADSDVMLAYDATSVFLQVSYQPGFNVRGNLTPQAMQQALKTINASHPLMGLSGHIAFGSDGSPQGKAVLVLYIDDNGDLQLESIPVGSFY